jgi:hypothetical protein
MVSYIGTVISGLVLLWVGQRFVKLRHNLALAKASGLPYAITRESTLHNNCTCAKLTMYSR